MVRFLVSEVPLYVDSNLPSNCDVSNAPPVVKRSDLAAFKEITRIFQGRFEAPWLGVEGRGSQPRLPPLRTWHTLEPLAWHWSHWPGRLVNQPQILNPTAKKTGHGALFVVFQMISTENWNTIMYNSITAYT